MDIVERLIAYRDHTGLSNSQFADRAGIPRPTLSQFLNGRNKRLSDDFTAKLHQAYPELNILWLLFGEGDMVTGANIKISEAKYIPDESVEPLQIHDYEDPAPYGTNINPTFAAATTIKQTPTESYNEPQQRQSAAAPAAVAAAAAAADPAKRVQYITVFYSDKSYEIFTPSPSQNHAL